MKVNMIKNGKSEQRECEGVMHSLHNVWVHINNKYLGNHAHLSFCMFQGVQFVSLKEQVCTHYIRSQGAFEFNCKLILKNMLGLLNWNKNVQLCIIFNLLYKNKYFEDTLKNAILTIILMNQKEHIHFILLHSLNSLKFLYMDDDFIVRKCNYNNSVEPHTFIALGLWKWNNGLD
jgi:hypothetical protein